jgi:hypothetical protein
MTNSTSFEDSSAGTQFCTVKEGDEGKVQLLYHTCMAPPTALPENFIAVLEKWGHTWI